MTYVRGRKRVTPEEIEEIRRRVAAGESYPVIGAALGRPATSVGNIVSTHDLRNGSQLEGPSKFRGPTKQDLARLRELIHSGMKAGEISATMKRSPTWVQVHSRRLKLFHLLYDAVPGDNNHAPLKTAPGNRAGEHTRDVMLGAQTGRCRHVTGEPGTDGFAMCGAPVAEGKLYCSAHVAAMYDGQGTAAAAARAAGRKGERTSRTTPKQGAGWHAFV